MIKPAIAPLLFAAALALAGGARADDPDLEAKARLIHSQILVLDGHSDVPDDLGSAAHDPGRDSDSLNDLPKLERGGVGASVLAVFTPTGPKTPEAIAKARAVDEAKLAAIKAIAGRYPDRAAIALTPDDVERIRAQGKRAIIIGYLNAYPLGTDIDAIDGLAKAGVRTFGFTHAGNTEFADSSRPQPGAGEQWGGLSPLGRQAVAKLNRLGLIIDVSQLTSAAFHQTLELTKAPVIATHSGVKGIVDNPRNLSDQELDALKANGGVIDIVAFSAYVARLPTDYPNRVKAVRLKFGLAVDYTHPNDGGAALPSEARKAFNLALSELAPRGTVSDLVDSVDYAVGRIGIDHVGLASDFNHGGGVTGWASEAEAENVTRELVKRGYTKEQITKLWGGNFLRVFREVQAVARRSAVADGAGL